MNKFTNLMQKKPLLAAIAFCIASIAQAQTIDPSYGMEVDSTGQVSLDESTFTFSETQLGEDEDMTQSVTIMSSNSNVYARQVGFLFSPARHRYRAFNQRYNEVFINGAPMNDMESGQFRFSNIGGLNNLTRNYDTALPFEDNNFTMPAMAGSNNYNFRAANVPTGHKVTATVANRNYLLRGMYTYGSGMSASGWSFAASIGYRWAKQGYVEGTFYNSLSYYLGIQKVAGNHSFALSTWGNPTERASQGPVTDEMYWIANDNQYNPYWGYQNGKKRNSRVVTDFQPSALFTWDWTISDNTSLTTTLQGHYSWYESTRLSYQNTDNPLPTYWKNMPSSYYDVWGEPTDGLNANRTDQGLADWNTAYEFLSASKENRQINWDRLYWANHQANAAGADAMYYLYGKHNDNLNFTFSTTLKTNTSKRSTLNLGLVAMTNKGMHYQTMNDLLGATSFHNINSYALGNYAGGSDDVQYDLNTMGADRKGKLIGVDDRFGYDYDLRVNKAYLWGNYTATAGRFRGFFSGRIGGTTMSRYGNMRNGMFPENSYGKSKTAKFLDGGVKSSVAINLGRGHLVRFGLGYQINAPQAQAAFVSPEMNNDFVDNLLNEKVFSSEFDYQYQNSWLRANINAYFSHLNDVTEWQNFYFDDINSFSYVSMTNISKEYYGVEVGLDFKLTDWLDLRAIGTWSEGKNVNNANVRYMNSTKKTYTDDIVMNEGMHESGTPLTALSLGLNYHRKGWYITLNGNYYDRIYLSYAPSYRYQGTLLTMYGTEDAYSMDENGNVTHYSSTEVPAQAKGKGGFMLDGSIGHSIRLARGKTLSINLMVTNILNNTRLCTGGFEQSRSDYTVKDDGTMNNERAYKFSRSPMKFYAFGTNGMLNFTLRF